MSCDSPTRSSVASSIRTVSSRSYSRPSFLGGDRREGAMSGTALGEGAASRSSRYQLLLACHRRSKGVWMSDPERNRGESQPPARKDPEGCSLSESSGNGAELQHQSHRMQQSQLLAKPRPDLLRRGALPRMRLEPSMCACGIQTRRRPLLRSRRLQKILYLVTKLIMKRVNYIPSAARRVSKHDDLAV